jgi:hypothetical protein
MPMPVRRDAVDADVRQMFREHALVPEPFLIVALVAHTRRILAGVPIVASVSAPSSLAVQLPREYGLPLIGFLRGPRFIVYAGETRVRD